MTTTISRLASASRQLDQKSRAVRSIVSTMNKKLVGLELNVEIWLNDDPIQASDYDSSGGNENLCPWSREAMLLGWSSHPGEWQLSVRAATLQTTVVSHGNKHEEVIDSTPPTPLLEEGHMIQVKAMRLLPRLLDELKRETTNLVIGIEEAREVAQML